MFDIIVMHIVNIFPIENIKTVHTGLETGSLISGENRNRHGHADYNYRYGILCFSENDGGKLCEYKTFGPVFLTENVVTNKQSTA